MRLVKKLCAAMLASAMLVTMLPAFDLATKAAVNTVDAEWYNFRNNPENNGVTNVKTPIDATETVQKWAVKYGTGWGAAPTPPLILNGKLYVGIFDQILELDKETGRELRRSDHMIGNVGFAMNPLTYADGKLFVQVGNGVIQAVDLATLKCLWYSEKIGGQTLCPISSAKIEGKEYLYTGTWNSENRDGEYFCISTDNENLTPAETNPEKGGGQIKQPTWRFMPSQNDPSLTAKDKRGFYWAGAYATEKYIAVGSDDGRAEGTYTPTATFYTLNAKTGAIIDKVEGIKGDIRSTTVYDNGYLYFSTKGGTVYKVKVDAEGRLSEASHIDIGAVKNAKVMATAAPLVYGNKLYMGICGPGGQFNPDGGHGFCVIDNSKALSQDSIMYEIPIKGYPQAAALASTAYVKEDFDKNGTPDGRVYLYFTYNAIPGGIYYCYDTADQKETKLDQYGELFRPAKAQQQYCISTICTDRKGTMYYKNDSCYLMAVEKNPAYANGLTIAGTNNEEIKWDQKFDPSALEYTLKIPATMEQATVTLDVNEGLDVKVNGVAYTAGMKVALPEGDSDLRVVVSKKEGDQTYARTYTLHMARLKAISTLASIKVGTSNGFNNFVDLSPAFTPDVLSYQVDTTNPERFWRVWLKGTDANATITVTGVENVESIDQVAGNYTTQGHDRWNVYKVDDTKSAKVKIDVLSEDKAKTTSYELTLLVPVRVTGVTLNKTEAELDATESLKLDATVAPADATEQAVVWSSSEETIATVDQNGLVTPKKDGTVVITAASKENADKKATCTITVKDAAKTVDQQITAIGTVTLDSKAKIDAARAAYNALTEAQKARVKKLNVLEAAEQKYEELKAAADKEAADKAAAGAVDQMITAIGTVTLDSKASIDAARNAYEALTADQKTLVTKLDTLVAAEKAYKELKDAADKEAADRAAAALVDKQITEIGTVSLAKKEQIEAARNAYEALTEAQKEFVTELDALHAAEQKYEELKAAADKEAADRAAAALVDKQITEIGEVTLEKKEQIEAARNAYEALTEAQKEFVTELDTLKAAEKTYKELKDVADQGINGQGTPEIGTPEQNEQTGNQNDSQNGQSEKPGKPENDQAGNHVPTTGDRAMVWVWVAVIVLAAAGIIIVWKRKK